MAGCIYNGQQFDLCTITVVFGQDPEGSVTVTAGKKGDQTLIQVFRGSCVVGGPDSPTPTGTFHASRWEKDHVSSKRLPHEDVPYSKTRFGDNAFGPYQLHILELEQRGIYIHGTIGPINNPWTILNRIVSRNSHGCIRMSNRDITQLYTMIPNPRNNIVIIKRADS